MCANNNPYLCDYVAETWSILKEDVSWKVFRKNITIVPKAAIGSGMPGWSLLSLYLTIRAVNAVKDSDSMNKTSYFSIGHVML